VSASDAVEDAPNVSVSVTKRSGKLRNDLKEDTFKAVISLRKEFKE
jgi:hypothetical protein